MPQVNSPGSTRYGVAFNTTASTANQVAATFPCNRNDTLYTLYAIVLAVATDNFDEGQSYGRVGTFLNDGGTVTQVGSTTSLWTHETVGGRDVDFNVDTPTVQLRVSPDDTTPLTWLIQAEVTVCQKWTANMGFVN
jgi:hypothetical protein